MKIYTRKGDDGFTALLGGRRVSKADERVAAYGTVDELNSHLGLAISRISDEQVIAELQTVQGHLFALGALLADARDGKAKAVVSFGLSEVTWLESAIDRMDQALPPLRSFVLPGGLAGAAELHVARTVCRRAERHVAALRLSETQVGEVALQYLNRLSDYLFTLARYVNHRACGPEVPWTPHAL